MTCKTPPTTFTRTWHISAAGDDTTGDGSAAKPWATPKSLFASGPWGGPRLASVPGAAASASLQPGDEVLVNDGSYGPLNVTLYGKQIVNKKWLRIAAAPGAHPIFDYLYVQGINRIVVSGQTLPSLKTDHFALVTVNGTDAQTRTTTSDIRVEDPERPGRQFLAGHHAGLLALPRPPWRAATCISIVNNTIRNVSTEAGIGGEGTTFAGNTVDGFGEDGVDLVGPGPLTVSKNTIRNSNSLADGTHLDGIQVQEHGTIVGLTIEANTVVRCADPARVPFPSMLQGIDAFDGDMTDVSVTANHVKTSACHGISFASVHDATFSGNVIEDDGSGIGTTNATTGKRMCSPWLLVAETTHEGKPSSNVKVTVNSAPQYSLDTTIPGFQPSGNRCITTPGLGPCLVALKTATGDVFESKPGMYSGVPIEATPTPAKGEG